MFEDNLIKVAFKLQLIKANTSDTEAPFLDSHSLFLTALFPSKFMINVTTLI